MSATVEPSASTVRSVPVPPELAARLRRIAKRLEDDTVERNRLIVEASDAGASLREIAAAAGITHVAVLKIIRANTQ